MDEPETEKADDNLRKTLNEMVWDRINDSVNQFLEERTLAELVENYRRLNMQEGNMYYI